MGHDEVVDLMSAWSQAHRLGGRLALFCGTCRHFALSWDEIFVEKNILVIVPSSSCGSSSSFPVDEKTTHPILASPP